MAETVDDAIYAALQIIKEGLMHKNLLLRAFTALIVSSGSYEYSFKLKDLEELDKHGLSYFVEDNELKVSIKFPEEYNFDGDSSGTLH